MQQLFGGDGFAQGLPDIGEDEHIDEAEGVAGLHPVMDADSSQTLAVLDAINGRNLVIQGPPGTGKSQTITNLIGEALACGRTILFVAEKMAALEVVKRRLDTVHLGDACLELHSHKTNGAYLPMNFGPLNRDGGERRLNVLINPGPPALHRVLQLRWRGSGPEALRGQGRPGAQDLPGVRATLDK